MKIIHYTICFILLLYGNTIKAEDLIIQKNGEDAIINRPNLLDFQG
jgi:hypothetical protein